MVQKMLNAEEVRRWLEGQQAAGCVIAKERTRFLLALEPDHALNIYRVLSEMSPRGRCQPSFVLIKMRQCMERWTTLRRGNA